MYYMVRFNKAFVPMALELGGRLKECVVIPSKVGAYAAELSFGEKSHFFQYQDSHKWQSYPTGPLWLRSWAHPLHVWVMGSCSPGREARSSPPDPSE